MEPIDISFLTQEYLAGKSLARIASRLRTNPIRIRTILVENKIKIREPGKSHYSAIDHRFFEKIDSKEKSYLLGFLCADGSINPENGSIDIQLQPRDKEILELFKKHVFFDSKITIKHWKTGYCSTKHSFGLRLCAWCVRLSRDLERLGCGNRKSFSLEFPKDHIPIDLLSHFIRGYFDGDGSIMMKKRYGKEIGACFDIISSPMFTEGLWYFLAEELKITCRIETCLNYSSEMKRLTTTKKAFLFKLFDFLYKDSADLRLTRKFEKFNECLGKIKDKVPKDWKIPKSIPNLGAFDYRSALPGHLD